MYYSCFTEDVAASSVARKSKLIMITILLIFLSFFFLVNICFFVFIIIIIHFLTIRCSRCVNVGILVKRKRRPVFRVWGSSGCEKE